MQYYQSHQGRRLGAQAAFAQRDGDESGSY